MDSFDEFKLSHEPETVIKYPVNGYAGTPGKGPAGQTCGTCIHLYRKQMGRVYIKCVLMEHAWTGGYGTDIRVHSPACEKWEKK